MDYFGRLISDCFYCFSKTSSDQSGDERLRGQVNTLIEENQQKDKKIKQLELELKNKNKDIEKLKKDDHTGPPERKIIRVKSQLNNRIKDASVNIVSPPSQINKLHQAFKDDLMAKCEDNGYRLVPTAGRASLVSVINSSRLVPDIKRDLAKFQEDAEEIILVIFKMPSFEHERPRVKLADIGDSRVRRAFFVMVEGWRSIKDCAVNDESFQDIFKYIITEI